MSERIPTNIWQRRREQGIIAAYTTPDETIGALVELHCETDFVVRTAEFHALGQLLARHIATIGPSGLTELAREASEYQAFLNRPLTEDPSKTVGQLLQEAVNLFAEGIEVKRFARMELG